MCSRCAPASRINPNFKQPVQWDLCLLSLQVPGLDHLRILHRILPIPSSAGLCQVHWQPVRSVDFSFFARTIRVPFSLRGPGWLNLSCSHKALLVQNGYYGELLSWLGKWCPNFTRQAVISATSPWRAPSSFSASLLLSPCFNKKFKYNLFLVQNIWNMF